MKVHRIISVDLKTNKNSSTRSQHNNNHNFLDCKQCLKHNFTSVNSMTPLVASLYTILRVLSAFDLITIHVNKNKLLLKLYYK